MDKKQNKEQERKQEMIAIESERVRIGEIELISKFFTAQELVGIAVGILENKSATSYLETLKGRRMGGSYLG